MILSVQQWRIYLNGAPHKNIFLARKLYSSPHNNRGIFCITFTNVHCMLTMISIWLNFFCCLNEIAQTFTMLHKWHPFLFITVCSVISNEHQTNHSFHRNSFNTALTCTQALSNLLCLCLKSKQTTRLTMLCNIKINVQRC